MSSEQHDASVSPGSVDDEVVRAALAAWPTDSKHTADWHPDDVTAYRAAGGWSAGVEAMRRKQAERVAAAVLNAANTSTASHGQNPSAAAAGPSTSQPVTAAELDAALTHPHGYAQFTVSLGTKTSHYHAAATDLLKMLSDAGFTLVHTSPRR